MWWIWIWLQCGDGDFRCDAIVSSRRLHHLLWLCCFHGRSGACRRYQGRRLAMPNSRIMMHQPLGGASGQAIDVEIQAKEVMYHKSNITRILSEITGRTIEQVCELETLLYVNMIQCTIWLLLKFEVRLSQSLELYVGDLEYNMKTSAFLPFINC